MLFRTPQDIVSAYECGLLGWQYNKATMERLFADGKATTFGAACPHLRGIGDKALALLWKSREKYDPGAFGLEAQVRGSCVSHGSRNCRDTTRSVEIDIKGEAEEYYKRGATEPTYGARGSRGEGMDPAVATRFEVDTGFLFREKYPFADLSKLNEWICDNWLRGMPAEMIAECKKHHVGRYVAPGDIAEAKALFAAGYACHSGQQFGVQASSDARGLAVRGKSWNHDMATIGMDDTKQVYPCCVFLVANSWGKWNNKPRVWPDELYGPWPVGSFLLSEEMWAQYFLRSRSMFFYCDVVGIPAKKLPNYGTPSDVLG